MKVKTLLRIYASFISMKGSSFMASFFLNRQGMKQIAKFYSVICQIMPFTLLYSNSRATVLRNTNKYLRTFRFRAGRRFWSPRQSSGFVWRNTSYSSYGIIGGSRFLKNPFIKPDLFNFTCDYPLVNFFVYNFKILLFQFSFNVDFDLPRSLLSENSFLFEKFSVLVKIGNQRGQVNRDFVGVHFVIWES